MFIKKILILSALIFVSSGFSLFFSYISKLVVDEAFIGRNYAKFPYLSLIGTAIFILSTLLNISTSVIKNRMDIKLRLKLAGKFTEVTVFSGFSFFQ